MVKQQKLHVENTLVSLAIVRKFQERKAFLEKLPARFLTEQEYREYKRIKDLESRFLN